MCALCGDMHRLIDTQGFRDEGWKSSCRFQPGHYSPSPPYPSVLWLISRSYDLLCVEFVLFTPCDTQGSKVRMPEVFFCSFPLRLEIHGRWSRLVRAWSAAAAFYLTMTLWHPMSDCGHAKVASHVGLELCAPTSTWSLSKSPAQAAS